MHLAHTDAMEPKLGSDVRNVHLYCPVMTVYDKPYNEMILWC